MKKSPARKALIIANRYVCFENTEPDMVLTATHKDASRLRRLLIGVYIILVSKLRSRCQHARSAKFGYKSEDIKILMDAPEDEALLAAMGLRNGDDFAPTRDNIVRARPYHSTKLMWMTDIPACQLAAMENLVSDAQPGDRFVFHCELCQPDVSFFLGIYPVGVAGHGGQIINLNGTEEDGYDEGSSFDCSLKMLIFLIETL